MSYSKEAMTRKERPTAENFIEWMQDHAFNLGLIGFSSEPPSFDEIMHKVHVGGLEQGELDNAYQFDDWAALALEKMEANSVRREERLKIMGDRKNKELLAEAENIVDDRLLTAGMTQQNIDNHSSQKDALWEKIIELYKLEHPVVELTGGVDAYVYLDPMYARKIKIYLPLTTSFSEFHDLLKGFCLSHGVIREPSRNGVEDEESKNLWKYNLITKNERKPLKTASVKLVTDQDYQTMIQEVTKEDACLAFAMIYEVSPINQLSSCID